MARRPTQRGSVAAELAIVLPLFIMLVVGIVEFGLAFNRLQGVHSAAREGARIGSISPGAECGQAWDSLDAVQVQGFACSVVQSCPGDKVVVEVKATEEIDIPLVGSRFVSLTGKGEFQCEG